MWLQSENQIADKPGGGHGVHEARGEFKATVLVHFSDEAKVTSVDVDGDWKWSSETRVSSEGGPERSVGLFSAAGGLTAAVGTDGRVSSFSVGPGTASSPGAAAVAVLLGTITVLVPIETIKELVTGIQRRAVGGKCATILPDPVSVHVKPDQTVDISAGLRDAKDQPITGTVKAQAAKATVTPEAQADPIAKLTYFALAAVPAGRTDTVTLKHISKRGRAGEQTVTIICDDPPPPPLPNAYGGTLSGTWDTTSTGEHWSYTADVELAYEGDEASPPPGAPPDRYRRFFITSGTAQVSVTITPPFGGCGYQGTGPVVFDAGPQSGPMIVQATGKPASFLSLRSVGKSITVTETGGAGCGGTQPYPVPGIWAQTQSAHTSATATLSGQENVPPPTPFDYETFSRWSLAPR